MDKYEIDFKEEVVKFHWLLLSPENSKRQFWEYVVTFTGLIDLFINIYGFYIESVFMTFNLIVVPIYLMEIYINCFSMYYNGQNLLVRSVRHIILDYMKFSFFVDFLCSAPLFLFHEDLQYF